MKLKLFFHCDRIHARPAPQKEISWLFLSVCLATLLFFSLPQTAHACGLIWFQVHSVCYFDGVDDQGNIFLIQKLGEMVTLGENRLPFYAVFKSESRNRSPYAGYGWSVPLLESKIVQVDENWFCLYQPDGFQRMLNRDKKDANILRSRKVWTAKIEGDTITAKCWCKNQGSKLVFRKGRLVSMVVKDDEFNYVYENDKVVGIREGDRTLLKMEKDPLTGSIIGLTLLNGQKIGLERIRRPLAQVQNLTNVTNITVESLSKIILPDGTIQTFEYGLDNKLNPTLKLNDREIVWDAATGKIIRDGEWAYGITLVSKPEENVSITRTNQQNQTEFWYKDNTKGEEITEGIDGVRKIVTWFTSGKLCGMMRKEMEIKNGIKKTLCEYSYNEKGQLMRTKRGKQETFMAYEEDGRLAAMVRNGVVIRNYTTNGTFLAKKYIE